MFQLTKSGEGGYCAIVHRSPLLCPQCGCSGQLELDSAVEVLLVECPACQTPLLLLLDRTFVLNRADFEKLARRHGFREHQSSLHLARPVEPSVSEAAKSLSPSASVRVVRHTPGAPVSGHVVNADDIIDLHRALDEVRDVEDFLRTLDNL